MAELPLFIPQIDKLTQGLSYDMALSEAVHHGNDFTVHPIEDPSRSFLIDHNREQPTEISISVIVSTTPCFTGATEGVDRIAQFQDALLTMRAAQSVDTSAFLKLYTGLRTYSNMAIRSLSFTRSPDTPNTLEAEIDFFEFRFASSPKLTKERYLMDANTGQRDPQNRPLVMETDRPIVEATRSRENPRLSFPTPNEETIIRAALRRLGVPRLAALDIGLSATGVI